MRLSIRWRLTLWNTLALAVVLAGFAALVYAPARATPCYEQTDRTLLAGCRRAASTTDGSRPTPTSGCATGSTSSRSTRASSASSTARRARSLLATPRSWPRTASRRAASGGTRPHRLRDADAARHGAAARSSSGRLAAGRPRLTVLPPGPAGGGRSRAGASSWRRCCLAVPLALAVGRRLALPAGPQGPGPGGAAAPLDRRDHRRPPRPPAAGRQPRRRAGPAGRDDQRHDRPAGAVVRRGPPLHRRRLARAADAADRHPHRGRGRPEQGRSTPAEQPAAAGQHPGGVRAADPADRPAADPGRARTPGVAAQVREPVDLAGPGRGRRGDHAAAGRGEGRCGCALEADGPRRGARATSGRLRQVLLQPARQRHQVHAGGRDGRRARRARRARMPS